MNIFSVWISRIIYARIIFPIFVVSIMDLQTLDESRWVQRPKCLDDNNNYEDKRSSSGDM